MNFWSKNLKRKMVTGGLLILLITFVFGTGCGKSGGSSESGDATTGADTVTITGDFENGNYGQNNALDKYFSVVLPPAYAFYPSRASKVLAFFGSWKHVVSNVTEDVGFSIDIAKGAPIGLVFVGESDNYLGYLTLSNGIDFLPLLCAEEETVTIDMENLYNLDKIVTPPARLFENAISLTAEEKNTLGFADNLFAATIVKNPAVNDHGTLDFLEGKFFRLFIRYFLYLSA